MPIYMIHLALATLSSLIFINSSATELEADKKLERYIRQFQFKALDLERDKNQELYNLGKKLFFDPLLSGNRNISCAHCHDPKRGSADALPLGLGQGAYSSDPHKMPIQTKESQLLSRHTPALFNVGFNVNRFFWDGRVEYIPRLYIYETPSAGLNGDYPEDYEISDALTGALAAQALFPLLSHEEMRGLPGENELADAKTDREVWSLIVQRITNSVEYKDLIKAAFANESINIAHIANALAEFQSYYFLANNTPWDRYLRGDLTAMSFKQKRGALVFVERGRCVLCHRGAHLSEFSFQNIAAPGVGEGFDIHKNDQGRFEVTKKPADLYKFRTPALRNIALTAPYFHSGAYLSLEEVLNHYESGVKALDQYKGNEMNDQYQDYYLKALYVETAPYRLFRKKDTAHPALRSRAIRLNSDERDDLLVFLKEALTDESFLER